MTRKLVFWVCFNTFRSARVAAKAPAGAPHPVTTLAWTERRIELFTKYNLRSILKQTYDDFVYIVLMDPELRAMTEPLMPQIDDRIIYCYEDAPGLAILREYDEVVLALMGSDDMYSLKAGEVIMNPDNREWSTMKYGYAYDDKAGQLYHYDTICNGPFFSHRIDPKLIKNFDRTLLHPGHKAVKFFNPQELAPGNFCVLLHDTNTSSHVGMAHVKGQADNGILEEFGICT
jgi:hypothetical protein